MNKKRHHQSRLARALFSLAGWFGRGESKAKRSKRMGRLDYSTSTQRMGLRFNERLRDVWRFRWLKIKR